MATFDATHELVSHIVEHHHAYARRALPYIVPLLARVAGFHGKRNAKLVALCEAGQALADALEAHVDEEEREIFPALLGAPFRADASRPLSPRPCEHPAEVMRLLARVHALADGYAAPEWASLAYRVLMEELEALEDDVSEYLHLESYVLAPRLASAAAAS
ncbi:MAG TPA: hemerythrin domain-containing protein [Anaeromyxobacter sp.]|nr:hemerythrin domain-containing protein [Anaeromyxobacter sp.]